jgi:hypothetical protein
LKPGPIQSMAMMICDAFGGGGAVVSVVSVLCGAGGGLTVQPDINVISADIATMTRTGLGTVFRVSAAARPFRPALAPGFGAGLRASPQRGVQLDLADADHLGRDLDALVLGAELHRLFEGQLERTGQRLHDVGRR